MAGPASPSSSDGPTFGPPPLPPGWIAQWDSSSKKYYFVQLSTGVSQWDTPSKEAPTGGDTPVPRTDHPFGGGLPNGGGQVITHEDGTRTIKYPDGRMEPLLSGEQQQQGDGTRGGPGGGDGDRGLGVSSFLLFDFLGGTGWLTDDLCRACSVTRS